MFMKKTTYSADTNNKIGVILIRQAAHEKFSREIESYACIFPRKCMFFENYIVVFTKKCYCSFSFLDKILYGQFWSNPCTYDRVTSTVPPIKAA